MKNNQITFPQYCFMTFIVTLSCLFFIDYNPSVLFYITIICSLAVDYIVISFYRIDNRLLKYISAAYLSVLCVIISAEFCKYLHYDLGYGPLWVLALIILGFAFFCTVKGLEPLARASVIISVFLFFSLIFIAVSSFWNIKFKFMLYEFKSAVIPLLLISPSAIYILNYDNIIKEKKSVFSVYSFLILVILVYFHLLPKNKVALGIFKGADGVLLAVLTVAVIYCLSVTTVSLFKNFKHRYICNSVFLSIILLLTIFSLYLAH